MIEKKGPVSAECLATQKYHIIGTVEAMEFIPTTHDHRSCKSSAVLINLLAAKRST